MLRYLILFLQVTVLQRPDKSRDPHEGYDASRTGTIPQGSNSSLALDTCVFVQSIKIIMYFEYFGVLPLSSLNVSMHSVMHPYAFSTLGFPSKSFKISELSLVSLICSAKEAAGMTVEWLFWTHAGTNWMGTLSQSHSKMCCSACLQRRQQFGSVYLLRDFLF